jgi:arsenate reductase-like glutaredoxin family protein
MDLKMEPLINMLLRCRQYYDSKHEVVRILVKFKKRENLLNQFEAELDKMDSERAKAFYSLVLKMSTRIYNQIERLRSDNPMLNRPFIYNNQNV